MSTKHTPGPWFEWEGAVYSGVPAVKRRGHLEGYEKQICQIDDLDQSKPEMSANARLIAAAPGLLKAALIFEEYCEAMAAGDDATAMLKYEEAQTERRAAIAQAVEFRKAESTEAGGCNG